MDTHRPLPSASGRFVPAATLRGYGRRLLLAALCLGGILTAASGPALAAPLEVFVSIPPQAFLVKRIGNDQVRVHTLIQPGQEPHTFEPTPKQILALARARLYFTVGLPFEQRLLAKATANPRLLVVDTGRGIARLRLADPDHPGEVLADPHIWLAPPLLSKMADAVLAGLVQADPGHRQAFEQRHAELVRAIQAIHARIAKILAPFRGASFYVFHPAFGYFARTYGLRQQAVETGGKSPSPRQLARLIRQARDQGVRIIFVQPQFDQRSAETVARAVGGVVVPLDPLAPDVLANLETVAREIEKALRPAPARKPIHFPRLRFAPPAIARPLR